MRVRTINQQAQRADIALRGKGEVNDGPLLRVVIDGSGCGQEGCDCSPRNFVTLSDGDTLLTVALSSKQARDLRVLDRLEVPR